MIHRGFEFWKEWWNECFFFLYSGFRLIPSLCVTFVTTIYPEAESHSRAFAPSAENSFPPFSLCPRPAFSFKCVQSIDLLFVPGCRSSRWAWKTREKREKGGGEGGNRNKRKGREGIIEMRRDGRRDRCETTGRNSAGTGHGNRIYFSFNWKILSLGRFGW